jgi:hypothetical protein
MRLRFAVSILTAWLTWASFAGAGEARLPFLVGLEVGTWKPAAISADRPLEPNVLPGTRALLGFSIGSSVRSDLDVLVSAQYWEQVELPANSIATRVRILPVGLHFRHHLAEGSWLSPFADYGAWALLGAQKLALTSQWDSQSGYGVSLGAGMSVLLGRTLMVIFRGGYLYAKFPRILGQTDDYSGTEFSLSLLLRL